MWLERPIAEYLLHIDKSQHVLYEQLIAKLLDEFPFFFHQLCASVVLLGDYRSNLLVDFLFSSPHASSR